MPQKEKSWPDIKYPSKRDDGWMTVDTWLEGKQQDDGAENLWRVHNNIYDLTKFVDKHPGGSMWLKLTKGTDITEAFESHHLSNAAEKKLSDFYVREAKSIRNSPFTFRPDGFYRVLKRRISEHFDHKIPPASRTSKMFVDFYFVAGLTFCVLAARTESFVCATLAGVLFGLVVTGGHNFVHMKDSFRNYYYYAVTFSVREWRISHCLSHHLFPNTLQDLEISLFEPAFEFLPNKNKSFIVRYVSWLYFPLVCLILPFFQVLNRIRLRVFTKEDYLLFVPPVLMLIFKTDLFSLVLWLWVVSMTGFVFTVIGLTAAHHSHGLFHEGDKPRKDRDWGLHQVETVHERKEIVGNVYLGLILFGEHTLHHLFPTLDHVYLSELIPIYCETLREFSIENNEKPWAQVACGTFRQLARIEPIDKER